MNGVDLIVDGGVRDKKQQAGFFGAVADDSSSISRQPSADMVDHAALERQERDLRNAFGHPDRRRLLRRDLSLGASGRQRHDPIHTYDLSQQTLAGYFQQTIGLLPTTDFSYGGRLQRTTLKARDILQNDPNCAIFFSCSVQNFPLDIRGRAIRPAYRPRTSLQ